MLQKKDGSIQRFKFCDELAWKASVKEMWTKASSLKVSLREMPQNNLILDFERWFDYVAARNKSSHTYDDKIAAKVYSAAIQSRPC